MQQGSICEVVLLITTKKWSFLEFPRISKEVKTKKENFQTIRQIICRLSHFSTIFLHHQWIGTGLLCYHQNVNVRVVERIITYYRRKLVNFNPWKAWNWWQVPSRSPKSQEKLGMMASSQPATQNPNFDSCPRKLQKPCCKTFQRNVCFR